MYTPPNWENLKHIYNFLSINHLAKLKQDQISNYNRDITPNEFKAVIKHLPTNKIPWPNGF